MDHLSILEVLPSCVWISSSMCLHLYCLNFLQLLLVLSHGPNHCFTSSSPPSIPHCPIATSSSRIFSFNFQNRTCTKTLLHCKVHEFSFSTSPHSPKIDSEQESYVHFIPALQSALTNFRTRNVQFSSTSSYTTSWSQSLLHIVVVASFNSSLSHCYLIFTNFFFQFPEQNMYWNIDPLRSARIFCFQWVLIRPKLIPNKRVMSISSQRCKLSQLISERAMSNVLPISPCTALQIH